MSSNSKSTGAGNESVAPHDTLQTTRLTLELPKADEVWSAWYKEADDQFLDFQSFGVIEGGGPNSVSNTGMSTGTNNNNNNASGNTTAQRSSSHRTLSARRISGQFEEEVAKSWEEDWEDEDVEDTFDAIMGQIVRYETTKAASAS